MLKRTIALLITLITLLSVVACGSDEKPDPGKVTEKTTTELTPEQILGFTPRDYEEQEVTMIATSTAEYEFNSESINGDYINDAIYKRNIACEEFFNIKFKVVVSPDSWKKPEPFLNLIKNSILADDDSFDLINGVSIWMGSIFGEGLFANIAEISSIDLDKSWWVSNQMEDFAINGKLYGILGDSNLSLYKNLNVYYFNQKLINDYNYESPYVLVNNKQWTIDKMIEMTKGVQEDLNGDNTVSYEYDRIGFASRQVSNRSLMTSSDIEVMTKNSNGEIEFPNALNEKFVNAYQKLNETFSAANYYVIITDDAAPIYKLLAEDRALFIGDFLYATENDTLRNMTSDYGIVPLPMYDENQDNYRTQVGTSTTMLCIPNNVSDTTLIGQLCEYMAYYGQKYLVDTYYEVILKGRYSTSQEMRDMFDLVRQTATYPMGFLYATNFNPFTNTWFEFSKNRRSLIGDNVVSYYESILSKYQSTLDTLLKKYE